MNYVRAEIRWASLVLAYCSGTFVLSSFVENQSYLKELVDWHEIGDVPELPADSSVGFAPGLEGNQWR